MIDIEKLKKYNELVVKYKLAEVFFDNSKVSQEEKDKRVGKVQDLYKNMSQMIKEFKKENIEATETELLEGFNIEFRMERYKKYGY